MIFRRLKLDETELLKDFLYKAIYIPEGVKPPSKDIINKPELRVYYEDFGSRDSDVGIVVENYDAVIGIVWARIMNDYGHVDDDTPSIAIAVDEEYRNRGVGTCLLTEMVILLKKEGYNKVSLAVQKDNFAVKMYKNAGFKIVYENEEEYIMVREL